MPRNDILSYEEIQSVARAASELGITKMRLTGGEPLVRAQLTHLVHMLSQIEGIDDISLTTNGVLLSRYAAQLKQAGLMRVNVSLDTLKRERFQRITGGGKLSDVITGMREARRVGLEPVKVNMVVMRGINDDEILDFARLTIDQGWHVRFIEAMPFTANLEFVPVSEIQALLLSLGSLEPYPFSQGNGPARYFRFPNASGTVGFISPLSEHFCFKCNRLRLTADGQLHPCLLSDDEVDLRRPLRQGASTEELSQLIRQAIAAKPERHRLGEGVSPPKRPMCQVGG